MNIFTEKNKISPSQESVTCVFDKRTGLHKFWSEYTFLAEMTKSEMKYFKDEKNLPYPINQASLLIANNRFYKKSRLTILYLIQ